MIRKYFITTFGCQANQADSERIAGIMETAGFQKAADEKSADVLIFNTCSVRQSAEDRIFGLNKKFRELKIGNPKLKIVLTGCMTHYSKKELKKRLPDIDLFLPIKEITKLAGLLDKNCGVRNTAISELPRRTDEFKEYLSSGKEKEYLSYHPKYQSSFRAFVPISTGCNNFCSYCVVPYSRGREYNRPAEEIISEVQGLASKNYKEIWLLGQNVNSWHCLNYLNNANRKSQHKIINFANLLRIINNIPGDFWIRFTSPHPKDFSDDLIKAMAECEKFGHYLNLPVQSGDNQILKKMNRPYTYECYIKLIEKIRGTIPDISLSTDVIVGFPGETKKQFQNTAELFKKIKFDMAYISEYSPRPGTLAAKKFKDALPKQEKARRKKELTQILAKTALENNKKLIGKTLKVLIDEEKRGRLFGRTEGNKVIELIPRAASEKIEIGEFAKVKIIQAEPWKLKGECLK